MNPSMSNFAFLKQDFPALHEEATLAERNALMDARVSSVYARRTLEGMVKWLYANDPEFTKPYDTTLNGLMGSQAFEKNVPYPVRLLAQTIRKKGNAAAHDTKNIAVSEAVALLRDLFLVLYWFASVYRVNAAQVLPAAFDETLVPPAFAEIARKTLSEILTLEKALKDQTEALESERAASASAKTELMALRAQMADRKTTNFQTGISTPSSISTPFSEAQTRERLIDLMLEEAGWDLSASNIREVSTSAGRADYVLWGQDGLPLAVIEAKKTSRDPRVGQKQALDYAEALEQQYGRLPIVFYSNGVKTFLWDKARGYPPRAVQGFYARDDLELMIQRRKTAVKLEEISINQSIADRYYQQTAIRKFSDRLEAFHRKGLLVMATGTGKTRVTIALIELLMRANWVKRVLFLADRNALVRQAKKAFVRHYPAANAINLVEEKDVTGARVVLSTYHTMMRQLEAGAFTVGHFDLIVVDEAHRSIYSTFGSIFEYFDTMLLGLTATPRDEVDRNTYGLFDMHDNLPVFEYGLEQAVRDGFLVPPASFRVQAKFLREGISYDDLTDDEKQEYDEIDWEEHGGRREQIQNTELYKWLFNKDTVDQVLETLMTHGLKVSGQDVLGKTIIFAQSIAHAQFIQERFDLNYPHLAGTFAQVIANNIERADQLIDQFSETPMPRIAISVDMLDTGIDVPEILNLVFFKRVQSKTKFWQMLGRGTRLSEDIFGTGKHKTEFMLFDFCGNLEFFNAHPKGIEARASESLEQRLFKLRIDVLQALAVQADDPASQDLHSYHANVLHERLCAMPQNNFLVRPHLELIERFSSREAWNVLSRLDARDIKTQLSSLPTAIVDNDENAKRFDSLVFQASLGILEGAPRSGVQNRIQALCAGLERKRNVGQIKQNLTLIQAVQTPEFWANAGASNLEEVRLRLRGLMTLIDAQERAARLETDFEDQFGTPEALALNALDVNIDREAYHKKVEAFIHAHLKHPVIQKLRLAQPLTQTDLRSLEEFLFNARELESRATFEWAYGSQNNLGRFIRSLVGLDRAAAKSAFGTYLDGKTFSSDQILFVNFIIDALTHNGTMSQQALFEAPFTDIHTQGINGLFNPDQVQALLATLNQLNTIETKAMFG